MEPAEQLRPRDVAVAVDKPPARPRRDEDMRFRRQRSVRWFSPGVLAQAGMRVVLSGAFGEFIDKRELQATNDDQPLSYKLDQDEVWFDFIADTGDGFDASYTVAWLAAQHQLAFPDHGNIALPRGELVILGGDEVYPVGDADAYEQRFVGPYRASLPWTWEPHPELFALAGNHDWYDGLTAFMRIFCQQKWIGGRRTRQTRSYFAIELPHRWWLWGIDIQLDSYIDEPQLRYFEDVVKRLQPGDRVILATASPSWVDTKADPRGYKNLCYLEHRLIRPTGARLMLSVSGDEHHYLHFEGADGTHKVTAGGGGAFLHPTHTHESHIEIQIDPSDEKSKQTFTETVCYPDKATSRRLAWRATGLPFRNPSFMVIPAVLYLLLGWSSQFAFRTFEGVGKDLDDAAETFGWVELILGLLRNPISIFLILLFAGGMIAFAKPPKKWPENPKRLVAKVVLGLIHLLMHLALVVGLGVLAVKIALTLFEDGLGFTITLLLFMALFGAVIGGLATGLYLALANAIPGLGAHSNETFSAIRLTSYKNFLRLHITPDGLLHVYPIGVRRALKDWKPDPDNDDAEAPWLAPDGDPPAVHLIEAPFAIDGRRPGGAEPPWRKKEDEEQPQVLPLRERQSKKMETS